MDESEKHPVEDWFEEDTTLKKRRGEIEDSAFCPEAEPKLNGIKKEIEEGRVEIDKIFKKQTLETEDGTKELLSLIKHTSIYDNLHIEYGSRLATFGVDSDGNLFAYNPGTGKYRNEGPLSDQELISFIKQTFSII